MKRLPIPVREVLGDAFDEAATQRVWREVARRRAPATRHQGLPRVAWALAAALAVVAAVFVWRSAARPDPVAGPIRLAGGAELSLAAPGAGASASSAAALDEGSRVEVFPGGRLSVLENSGRALTLLLENGHARFAVTPGGPRRWVIECGVVSVEVAGTRFEVERAVGGAVHVRVEEGVVLVRGDVVPDRVLRMTAGESRRFGEPVGAASNEAPAPETSATAPAAHARSDPAPAGSAKAPPAPNEWRQLARRGEYKEAYGVLGREGIAQEARSATLDELMELADIARLSGHPTDAVAPLARVVAEHRGDPRAGMAAFTLGRLRLDALGQPAAAAASFADALALGLPGGLVEDAHARLVEARSRAGDRSGAKAAAEEYERRFPSGRRLPAVRAWAGVE